MVMPTSLASFTKLVCSMVNYINKIDHFTNSDGDRSNGFETILRYPCCTEHKNTLVQIRFPEHINTVLN